MEPSLWRHCCSTAPCIILRSSKQRHQHNMGRNLCIVGWHGLLGVPYWNEIVATVVSNRVWICIRDILDSALAPGMDYWAPRWIPEKMRKFSQPVTQGAGIKSPGWHDLRIFVTLQLLQSVLLLFTSTCVYYMLHNFYQLIGLILRSIFKLISKIISCISKGMH